MRVRVTIRARVDLRIDSDLKDWATEYAKTHRMTLTELVCEQLEKLRTAERKKQPGDLVEQF